MYWKDSEFQDDFGITWIIYNYFAITQISPQKPPYYNGLTKQFVYIPNRDLVIRARMAESEEAFLEWYHQNKTL